MTQPVREETLTIKSNTKTRGLLKKKREGMLSVLWIMCMLGSVWFFATPWTVARKALLSMGLSRQEYWSGLPCPPPGDLPNPRSNMRLLHWQGDSLPWSHWKGSPLSNTEKGSLYRRLDRSCLERASMWQRGVEPTGPQRPPCWAHGLCGCALCLMDLSHLSKWLNPCSWRQTGSPSVAAIWVFISAVEARFKNGSSSCCIWVPCVWKNVETGSDLDGVHWWDSGAVLLPMNVCRVHSPLDKRGPRSWQVIAGCGVYILKPCTVGNGNCPRWVHGGTAVHTQVLKAGFHW